MQRVFLPPANFAGERLQLSPDVAHYLRRVLRLNAGAEFLALDGSGAQYRARLLAEELTAEIVERLPDTAAAGVELTLYQGLPRSKRFALVLQKATELGVARIVAVTTARSQVHLNAREAERKLEHWQRIVTEAAEQCERPCAPTVLWMPDWAAAMADWQAREVPGLLLDETLAGTGPGGLRAQLETWERPPALALWVGPEGGFSPAEADAGRAAGLAAVGLGSRILRTETAALIACALVMYEYGELG